MFIMSFAYWLLAFIIFDMLKFQNILCSHDSWSGALWAEPGQRSVSQWEAGISPDSANQRPAWWPRWPMRGRDQRPDQWGQGPGSGQGGQVGPESPTPRGQYPGAWEAERWHLRGWDNGKRGQVSCDHGQVLILQLVAGAGSCFDRKSDIPCQVRCIKCSAGSQIKIKTNKATKVEYF